MQDDIKPPPEPNQSDGPAKVNEPVKPPPDQQTLPPQEPPGPKKPPATKQPAAQDPVGAPPANPDKDQSQTSKSKKDTTLPEALKNQSVPRKESHLGPVILAIILLIFLAAVAIVSETQTDF